MYTYLLVIITYLVISHKGIIITCSSYQIFLTLDMFVLNLENKLKTIIYNIVFRRRKRKICLNNFFSFGRKWLVQAVRVFMAAFRSSYLAIPGRTFSKFANGYDAPHIIIIIVNCNLGN